MQEQPPSDPPRREPRTAARRGRSPKPTFTPPAVPATEPDQPDDPPRARPRRKASAPTVLFQPPETTGPTDPEQSAMPPRRAPRQKVVRTATPGQVTTPSRPARPAAGDSEHTVLVDAGNAPTSGPNAEAGAPREATAKKSTTRKATEKPAATARKSTRKASSPGAAAPEPVDHPVKATAEAGTPQPSGAPETAAGGHTVDLDRLLAHPAFTPELLALAAVERLGPQAGAWAAALREAYPNAGSAGLARLATRRFVRLAGWGGATAALAGLFAPLAELVTVLWTQSGLVLHLAAAYGRDPVDPERAVELLVLTRVHPDTDSARTALVAARAETGEGEPPWDRVAEAAWRLATPLAAQAGGWLALRMASRLLPGAAVLATAAGNSAAVERLAARTITAYRQPGFRWPQSQSNHSLGSRE
ncbi:hypothetical protein [Micromonospora sp. NBRC 101691]|uniref:hypothetical protein n=1 Tax=Micromonospora sp. NBRC 101691 TaxID=3032198 RepID=UPI0024A2F952|nr:hypothetical protein [Micromonospora sp. NBRC 101691]GLY25702.1 hypothetical protein Misp04_54330 [Micromonospora sp. NBRC 101691]